MAIRATLRILRSHLGPDPIAALACRLRRDPRRSSASYAGPSDIWTAHN
jgi:hypothetical protein